VTLSQLSLQPGDGTQGRGSARPFLRGSAHNFAYFQNAENEAPMAVTNP
jgi:hypothetical protein